MLKYFSNIKIIKKEREKTSFETLSVDWISTDIHKGGQKGSFAKKDINLHATPSGYKAKQSNLMYIQHRYYRYINKTYYIKS